jgi:hypothetical protein
MTVLEPAILAMLNHAQAANAGLIPLWVKVAYTAFLCVLVPVYWVNYTPANFLWFCDIALFLTLIAVWTENPLPANMAAIAIVLPQLLWIVDLIDYWLTGSHHVTDLTAYMFEQDRSKFLRALSLFHGWLPLLLVWLVMRLGYDRRAIVYQPVVTAAVLVVSALVIRAPGHPAGNINKVLGPNDAEMQTMMPKAAWVAIVFLINTLAVQIPSHWLFRWLARASSERLASAMTPAEIAS